MITKRPRQFTRKFWKQLPKRHRHAIASAHNKLIEEGADKTTLMHQMTLVMKGIYNKDRSMGPVFDKIFAS